MNEQPTWCLTGEMIAGIVAKNISELRYPDVYVRAGAEAQAKALVEWFSRQLFDEANMDESLDMISGIIVGPRWLVQLRKEVGLE